MNITRRDALKQTALLGATVAIAPHLLRAQGGGGNGEFSLMPLPYAVDALEPAIDARTMQIHHDKHHAGYIRKLNLALKDISGDYSYESLFASLDQQPESVRTSLRNNGGGAYNHNLFWTSMAPPSEKGGGMPQGELALRIKQDFGSMNAFQEKFSSAASSVFGSGWAWLVVRASDDKLIVTSTANQDNPLMTSIVAEEELGTPILGLDVWEHAYYLHYQNRRTDYISNWWKVVNWTEVAKRLG